MASLFFYISRNINVYERVKREVTECFGCNEEICIGAKLNSCIYLRACLDESLRMSPPVGGCLFREVQDGGAIVDGNFLPKGVTVGTGVYSVHHNANVFPDPFNFDPERWLPKSRRSNPHRPRGILDACVPFSLGSRSCVGKSLAIQEVMLAMAMVLYNMEFRTVEKECSLSGGRLGAEYGRHRPEEFQLWDHVNSAKRGPLIQFRYRNGPAIDMSTGGSMSG
jgi:cytochrome P450